MKTGTLPLDIALIKETRGSDKTATLNTQTNPRKTSLRQTWVLRSSIPNATQVTLHFTSCQRKHGALLVAKSKSHRMTLGRAMFLENKGILGYCQSKFEICFWSLWLAAHFIWILSEAE